MADVKRYEALYPVADAEHCMDCGRPYALWWEAPDWLWKLLIGRPGGLLCPDCLDRRADAQGIVLRWRCEREEEGS